MFEKLKAMLGLGQTKASGAPVFDLDRTLARISLFDEVVRAQPNPDGSVTIFVRGDIADSYEHIVGFIREHAPGVHGELRRAVSLGGGPLLPIFRYPPAAVC